MSRDQRLVDLSNLAIARMETAIDSVAQLMERDAEVYALYVAVATSIVMVAADHLFDALESQQRKKLPRKAIQAARVHVVSEILDNLGIEHMSSDESMAKAK